MRAADQQGAIEAQLRRSRARVATSKQSIARCAERILESHQAVMMVMGKAVLSEAARDDQLQAAEDWSEAAQQQRLIDFEVRQTAGHNPDFALG